MPVRTCPTPSWARLSGWPDAIADEDGHLFTLTGDDFTLTGDDLAWLAGFNRDDKRLGVALQLCALPRLGWIPDEIMKQPHSLRC